MKQLSRKKKVAKRVLHLPDLDFARRAVLNTLGSSDSKRAYEFAIDHFVTWYCSEPRLAFSKTVVLRYPLGLEARRLAPAQSIFASPRAAGSRSKPPIPASSAPNSPQASRA